MENIMNLDSVINLNEATRAVEKLRINYGVYAIFLKMEKSCLIRYGRQEYDYEEGAIVCFAPGQTAVTTPTKDKIQSNVYGILFHPDLLRGTPLNRMMKQYSFFSYESNEALMLSEEERGVILDCMKIIAKELEHNIDKHSKTLIATYIELLLGYCMRFYERQFITREDKNKSVVEKLDTLLAAFINSGSPILPTADYCASTLGLSTPYFIDMLKFETGKTLDEYFHDKRNEAVLKLQLKAES